MIIDVVQFDMFVRNSVSSYDELWRKLTVREQSYVII